MATDVFCTPDLQNLLQSLRDLGNLKRVLELLSKLRGKTFNLKKPAGATWMIADVNNTIYKGRDDEIDEWGKFYLPDEVTMQVFGVVKGTSCPCDQLVLMTCEDKKIYGYDGEQLHVVASNTQQLWEKGIEYPASKSYYNGEAFKNMTDKDWNKVRQGPVGKSLDEAHHKLVSSKKTKLLANLTG